MSVVMLVTNITSRLLLIDFEALQIYTYTGRVYVVNCN